MRRLAASLQAELRPSLPHHHQANPVERTIQTAKFVLQSLCVTSKAHWDRRAVPAAELAINSTPSVTTGERPFDLIFVAHPDLVHAVFDSEEHSGVGSFAERLAAADARLAEARESVSVARAAQKRNYDRSHAALPILERGARVFVRLDDRPMPGASRDKLSSRKQGPYEVIEVLSPHRVRLALPAGIGIGDEFDVSQLDVEPALPNPFAAHRVASPPASRQRIHHLLPPVLLSCPLSHLPRFFLVCGVLLLSSASTSWDRLRFRSRPSLWRHCGARTVVLVTFSWTMGERWCWRNGRWPSCRG
ncbi:hypothetical protein A4X06_0g8457 [Tilletia controversa]|uniref:Tf2-1-like SH3-like domain-containing protein n=1 Tax=Tilletia controversa TaxID=13291 RepID=A0A8X7ST58_9BASI|nr:hypothetical protein A4X06_0g8457 [Tilletia controversa]